MAQPANNAMLPAPPVTALYRDFYNDPASDVFNRNYTDVLAPYNPTTGGTPAEVRTLACHCRSQGVPSAYLLLHTTDLKLHVYTQLDLFNPRMGLPATPWDDQMFIGKGELFNNQQTLVRWDPDYFRQGNATRVPTPMELSNLYAANGAANIVGPFTIADADTEVITTRRTCYIPPPYVALLLDQPVTPREAWDLVYSQIVADGNQVMCAPLVNFLRCAATRSVAGDPPIIAQDEPTVPLADHVLMARQRNMLEVDFPFLSNNVAHVQTNQIAAQVGLLVSEARANRAAEAAARATTLAGKTPLQFLGPVGLLKLLRYCQVGSAAQLPPFWVALADAPKRQQLSILQWEINRVKELVNEPDLEFTATGPLLEAITKLNWEMNNSDSVTTGLNVFMVGDASKEEANSSQQLWELLHSNGAAPSLADATSLLKVKAGAPIHLHETRHQLRRFEIIVSIIMGAAHPLTTCLSTCGNRMLSMERFLYRSQSDVEYLPVKILKRIAVPTSIWFQNQSASPTPITPPNLSQLFDDMLADNYWQPTLTSAFLSSVGLSTPTPGSRPNAPNSAPPPPPVVAGANPDRNNNLAFNTALFSTYKASSITCRSLRDKIRAGDLPALPNSKVDRQVMCLAWHTKGMCNVNCSRKADHVSYTAGEYAGLVTWCTQNFNTN